MTHATLVGAEDVLRASRNIEAAAEVMQRVATQFSHDADRLIRAMEDHATRMENLAELRGNL